MTFCDTSDQAQRVPLDEGKDAVVDRAISAAVLSERQLVLRRARRMMLGHRNFAASLGGIEFVHAMGEVPRAKEARELCAYLTYCDWLLRPLAQTWTAALNVSEYPSGSPLSCARPKDDQIGSHKKNPSEDNTK